MVKLFYGLGTGSPSLRDWGSISVMLIIGLGGGLLYATVSGWDYGSVLTRLTRYGVEAQTTGPSLLAIVATLGSIAEGITAAIKDGSFRLLAPQAEHIAHRLAWAIQAELTIDEILAMPVYHPVLEEGMRTALRDLARQLEHTDNCRQHANAAGE